MNFNRSEFGFLTAEMGEASYIFLGRIYRTGLFYLIFSIFFASSGEFCTYMCCFFKGEVLFFDDYIFFFGEGLFLFIYGLIF
jgi:hypothetical protein